MNEINIQEIETIDNKTKIVIITYNGYGDPTLEIDEVIKNTYYIFDYYEFIDANMDNPWVRILMIKL